MRRYSLRAMLVAVGVLALVCGEFARRYHNRRRITQAVETIKRHHYQVSYPRTDQSSISPSLRNGNKYSALYALYVHEHDDGTRGSFHTPDIARFVNCHDADGLPEQMADELLAAINQLEELEFLGMFGRVSDAEFSRLDRLRSITWLDLSHCDLAKDPFDQPRFGLSLRTLDLTGVSLSEGQAATIAARFPNLTALSMGYSNSEERATVALGALTKLTTLVLTDDAASRTRVYGSIDGLPQLSHLVLASPLTVGEWHVTNCPRLRRIQSLDLGGHRLTHSVDVGRLTLENLPSLRVLDLRAPELTLRDVSALHTLTLGACGHASIKGALPLRTASLSGGCAAAVIQAISPIEGLENLVVSQDGSITDATMALLEGCGGLRYLTLNGCEGVTAAGLNALRELPIESLCLLATPVTDEAITLIATYESLRRVDLRETEVTAVGLDELRKRRPTLEIVADTHTSALQ